MCEVCLHIHLNPILLKYTYVTKLPDVVGVQQLHSSCAFVEVIFLLSSESETLVSNDFKILALFLQVVSAFNFEHLQTEKNREKQRKAWRVVEKIVLLSAKNQLKQSYEPEKNKTAFIGKDHCGHCVGRGLRQRL